MTPRHVHIWLRENHLCESDIRAGLVGFCFELSSEREMLEHCLLHGCRGYLNMDRDALIAEILDAFPFDESDAEISDHLNYLLTCE